MDFDEWIGTMVAGGTAGGFCGFHGDAAAFVIHMARIVHSIVRSGAQPRVTEAVGREIRAGAASRPRVPRLIVILLLGLLCLSLGMLTLFHVDWRPLIEGKNDLWSMIGAADAFLHSRPLYNVAHPCANSGCFPFPFAYPPGGLLPFVALVGVQPYWAFALFTGLSVGVFVLGVVLLLRRYTRCSRGQALAVGLGGLLLFPAVDNILWGQSQLLLTGMIALAITAPPVAGGLLIGVASYYKLYPALLIGAFWLNGERRRAGVGAATAAVLGLASLAFFGLGPHLEFLRFLASLVAFFSLPQYHIANYSLRSMLVFYDLPMRLVDLATLVVSLGWALGAWRLRDDRQRCYAFTLGASLLMSPIVWRNYFLLGIPIAILLYRYVRSHGIVVQSIYLVGVLMVLTAGLNLFVPALASLPTVPLIGVVALCGLCFVPPETGNVPPETGNVKRELEA
jgi:Glycosyltransferase family 87